MIDLVWNFPLLEEQAAMWREHLAAAMAEYGREPVESQRPSFRTVELKLRERAAAWLGFAPARTWITCGGHHGTLNALLASGLAGARVAVEGTSYPGLLDQCKMLKTEVVACAIDDGGRIGEARRGVYVAVDGQDFGDAAERAEFAFEHGQLGEGAGAGRGVAVFDGAVEAGGAGDDPVGVCRDDAGEVDDCANALCGEVVSTWSGELRQR